MFAANNMIKNKYCERSLQRAEEEVGYGKRLDRKWNESFGECTEITWEFGAFVIDQWLPVRKVFCCAYYLRGCPHPCNVPYFWKVAYILKWREKLLMYVFSEHTIVFNLDWTSANTHRRYMCPRTFVDFISAHVTQLEYSCIFDKIGVLSNYSCRLLLLSA